MERPRHELSTTLWAAWLSSMLLLAVELGTLPFRYAFALSGGTRERVELVLLSFSLATWMAPCVAAYALGVRALAPLARRFPALGRNAQLLTLALTAALIAVSQHGVRLSAPAPLEAAALALPALGLLVLHRHAAVRRHPVEVGAAALASTALAIFYLATFETGMLFASARFGLGSASELQRTLVVLGVPAVVLALGALAPASLRMRPRPGQRVLALGGALLCLLLLQHVNDSYFVDLHQPVHTALLWGSYFVAWWMASVLLELPRFPRAPRARTVLLSLALCAGLLAVLARGTVASYVAAVHTAHARAGMEALFGVVRDPLRALAFRVDSLVRFARDARGIPLPASRLPLPSTFALQSLDAQARRATPDTNLVVFFLDTKRTRDFGPDAHGRSRTPAIDRCFGDGARFDAAMSNATQTLTVFPSIYTGIHAGSHGQLRPDLLERPTWLAEQRGERNLVEQLKAAGFHTRLLTNRYYLQFFRGPKYRHLFGAFDTIVPADESLGQNEGLVAAFEQSPQLVAGDRRFALVVHVMSHSLEALPMVDRVVGTVCERLQARGLRERTALMLTADHGFQQREHGRTTYGRTLFDEELRVPLLWRVPGFSQARVAEPVSAVDHLPTVADVLGVRLPFPVEGRSYLPALRGERWIRGEPLYFEVRRHEIASTGVLWRGLKLIRWHNTQSEALFDLRADPGERRNLVGDAAHAAARAELSALVDRFRAERGEAD